MKFIEDPAVQRGKAASRGYLFTKRAVDILASVCGILLFSPFMLLTAILIKASDGGPVIYQQIRLTKNRKAFKILKFRSMVLDAEKDGVARLSSGDRDIRVTPVGHFIRTCHFDEIPQLFNILRGDMTFVGPRPERPEIAERYEKELPDFAQRLRVKAGLTGYAQLYGTYSSPPAEKLKYDLRYINRMNTLTDLEILFKTFCFIANAFRHAVSGTRQQASVEDSAKY